MVERHPANRADSKTGQGHTHNLHPRRPALHPSCPQDWEKRTLGRLTQKTVNCKHDTVGRHGSGKTLINTKRKCLKNLVFNFSKIIHYSHFQLIFLVPRA